MAGDKDANDKGSNDQTNDTGTGSTPGQVNDEVRDEAYGSMDELPQPDQLVPAGALPDAPLEGDGATQLEGTINAGGGGGQDMLQDFGIDDPSLSQDMGINYDEVTGGVHNLVGDPLANSDDPVPGMNPEGDGWKTVPGTEATGFMVAGPGDETGDQMSEYMPNLTLVDRPGQAGDPVLEDTQNAGQDMLPDLGIDDNPPPFGDPALADQTPEEASAIQTAENLGASESQAVIEADTGQTATEEAAIQNAENLGQSQSEAIAEADAGQTPTEEAAIQNAENLGQSQSEAIAEADAGQTPTEEAAIRAAENAGESQSQAIAEADSGLTPTEQAEVEAAESSGESSSDAIAEASQGLVPSGDTADAPTDAPGYTMSDDNVADFGNYSVDFGSPDDGSSETPTAADYSSSDDYSSSSSEDYSSSSSEDYSSSSSEDYSSGSDD